MHTEIYELQSYILIDSHLFSIGDRQGIGKKILLWLVNRKAEKGYYVSARLVELTMLLVNFFYLLLWTDSFSSYILSTDKLTLCWDYDVLCFCNDHLCRWPYTIIFVQLTEKSALYYESDTRRDTLWNASKISEKANIYLEREGGD